MKLTSATRKLLLAFILIIGHWSLAVGQSNYHYITFSSQTDTLLLDSLSVVPNTVVVRNSDGEVIDSSNYFIKAFESKLVWKNKPAADSVRIFFRTYPFALARETYNKSYREYQEASANTLIRPFAYRPDEVGTKLIDFGSLDYNGSFSRGLAFGSNQSVVLNSLFNLQLSGMLTKDLEITAAITDNNIPIQPEGNTQQIQEFDKIFIQLRQGNHKVIVGDFDLFNPEKDYFMKFSKKYQGGFYSGAFDFKKARVFKTGVAGGISRGKFARNTLTVSEGNQGPYKLSGANGETFIIILANTEEVFINGSKMERGADRDYIIDYNLGEVTFMPRKIITKDLRVVIEFEYSDRNYMRSTAFLNTEYLTKTADVHFNLYTEQDSKGQNIQQNLTADKKTFLTTVGDSLSNALYRGFDSVGFDPNRILYRLVLDSLGYDSVFVYSTDTLNAKYSVSFSLVGQGRGDYVPASSTANGRVYEWVAPLMDSLGIHPQGSYEPVIFLVTPKYQQIYTLGTDVRINKSNVVSAEVAMSNNDLNMFSKKDDQDNLGFAGRFNIKGSVVTKLDSASNKKNSFVYDVNYEFLQNRFNTIERYRNIEFNRDWNLAPQAQRYNEHLAIANIGYLWSSLGNINYRFKAFLQDSVYRGFENGLNGIFSKNGFNFIFNGSYLNSKSAISQTNFVRPKADFFYASPKTKGWKIGALFDHEINRLKLKGADTLTANSYLWQNYKVYVTNADSSQNKYGFEFIMRYEHRPEENSFKKPFFSAQTVNFTGQVNSIKNQTLNYSLTYRHVKDDDSLDSQQPEHFYLGRIDYNFTALKGFFRSTTLYEVGSGRQQKTQIVYLSSPTNQGDFIYPENGDVNSNGVKDVSEFVIRNSSFSYDSSYIRTYIVTPEFIMVNINQFNEVININPAALWKNKEGVRKVIALFSLFASVSITKKTFAAKNKKAGDYFNPFPLKKENNDLVSTSVSSRNTLYFNRLNPKYGVQFDFNYSRNRTLLTTGFENRTLQSQGASVRWNAFKSFNILMAYTNGLKTNESDFYKNLQYRFTYNDASADLSYQFGTSVRLGAKYDFSIKENPTDTVGKQTAQVHKVTAQVRYNRQSKSTIDANLSYATIAYNDKNYQNQQLEYAMLEGLRNGNNLVWSVGYSQNLTDNIQLTLTYDGRMTGFNSNDKSTVKPVHTGRAEIRAVF
ncbi:MAG: hypothetical protein V4615_06345 [Bacteroidota bacterium]